MTVQNNQERWQEYLELENSLNPKTPTPEEMAETLVQERLERRLNTTRHLRTPLERYELKIASIAEQECKTPAQWRKEETYDIIRINALGSPRHKSIGELLEDYPEKLQRAHKNEKRIMAKIKHYESKIQIHEQAIKELSNTGFRNRLRSAKNKLEHAKGCKILLERELSKKSIKIQRYEQLFIKWTGINEKFKLSDIRIEIEAEKAGTGNKYGFNPKAQSRETAEITFQD